MRQLRARSAELHSLAICARVPAHTAHGTVVCIGVLSSLVGAVICSRQLLGNNTPSYRTMSPIRSTLLTCQHNLLECRKGSLHLLSGPLLHGDGAAGA